MKTKNIIIIICNVFIITSSCIIIGLTTNQNTMIWTLKHTPGFPQEKTENYIVTYNNLQEEIKTNNNVIDSLQIEIDSLQQKNKKEKNLEIEIVILINKHIKSNKESVNITCEQQIQIAKLETIIGLITINIIIILIIGLVVIPLIRWE